MRQDANTCQWRFTACSMGSSGYQAPRLSEPRYESRPIALIMLFETDPLRCFQFAICNSSVSFRRSFAPPPFASKPIAASRSASAA